MTKRERETIGGVLRTMEHLLSAEANLTIAPRRERPMRDPILGRPPFPNKEQIPLSPSSSLVQQLRKTGLIPKTLVEIAAQLRLDPSVHLPEIIESMIDSGLLRLRLLNLDFLPKTIEWCQPDRITASIRVGSINEDSETATVHVLVDDEFIFSSECSLHGAQALANGDSCDGLELLGVQLTDEGRFVLGLLNGWEWMQDHSLSLPSESIGISDEHRGKADRSMPKRGGPQRSGKSLEAVRQWLLDHLDRSGGRKLSHRQLAKLCDCAPSTICKVINNFDEFKKLRKPRRARADSLVIAHHWVPRSGTEAESHELAPDDAASYAEMREKIEKLMARASDDDRAWLEELISQGKYEDVLAVLEMPA